MFVQSHNTYTTHTRVKHACNVDIYRLYDNIKKLYNLRMRVTLTCPYIYVPIHNTTTCTRAK